MRTKTKALALVLCAVLLVVSTVFATMAFLTDRDTVQNTFTFGKVGITLLEAEVNTDGTVKAGGDRTVKTDRVQANEYHLIPGHTYVKDPTIYVDSDSEDCWLFVKLKNDLNPIIAAATIEDQMSTNGWTCIDPTNNIWTYKETAAAGSYVPVFDHFKLTDGADVALYATQKDTQGNVTGGATINVTAYAVQADGFNDVNKTALENASAAWNATSDNFN